MEVTRSLPEISPLVIPPENIFNKVKGQACLQNTPKPIENFLKISHFLSLLF